MEDELAQAKVRMQTQEDAVREQLAEVQALRSADLQASAEQDALRRENAQLQQMYERSHQEALRLTQQLTELQRENFGLQKASHAAVQRLSIDLDRSGMGVEDPPSPGLRARGPAAGPRVTMQEEAAARDFRPTDRGFPRREVPTLPTEGLGEYPSARPTQQSRQTQPNRQTQQPTRQTQDVSDLRMTQQPNRVTQPNRQTQDFSDLRMTQQTSASRLMHATTNASEHYVPSSRDSSARGGSEDGYERMRSGSRSVDGRAAGVQSGSVSVQDVVRGSGLRAGGSASAGAALARGATRLERERQESGGAAELIHGDARATARSANLASRGVSAAIGGPAGPEPPGPGEDLERRLTDLTMERQLVGSQLNKHPTSGGGRSLAQRKEKQVLEARLEELDTTISATRRELRRSTGFS